MYLKLIWYSRPTPIHFTERFIRGACFPSNLTKYYTLSQLKIATTRMQVITVEVDVIQAITKFANDRAFYGNGTVKTQQLRIFSAAKPLTASRVWTHLSTRNWQLAYESNAFDRSPIQASMSQGLLRHIKEDAWCDPFEPGEKKKNVRGKIYTRTQRMHPTTKGG